MYKDSAQIFHDMDTEESEELDAKEIATELFRKKKRATKNKDLPKADRKKEKKMEGKRRKKIAQAIIAHYDHPKAEKNGKAEIDKKEFMAMFIELYAANNKAWPKQE